MMFFVSINRNNILINLTNYMKKTHNTKIFLIESNIWFILIKITNVYEKLMLCAL